MKRALRIHIPPLVTKQIRHRWELKVVRETNSPHYRAGLHSPDWIMAEYGATPSRAVAALEKALERELK